MILFPSLRSILINLCTTVTFYTASQQSTMADPLSILGAAVGVTSLIMQTTDECVKGYNASYYVNIVIDESGHPRTSWLPHLQAHAEDLCCLNHPRH